MTKRKRGIQFLILYGKNSIFLIIIITVGDYYYEKNSMTKRKRGIQFLLLLWEEFNDEALARNSIYNC
jgi:hypothetical protein